MDEQKEHFEFTETHIYLTVNDSHITTIFSIDTYVQQQPKQTN